MTDRNSTCNPPCDRRQFMLGVAGSAGVLALDGLDAAALDQPPPGPTDGIRALILGTAQDGGVPHAGCRKAHCEAARSNPGLRRRSPCLALLDGKRKQSFVIDAGPDFPAQLYDLPHTWPREGKPVDGIFLTHAHVGHYTGLMHLGRAVMNSSRVPVYCSQQMAVFLRTNGPWSLLVKLGNIELHPIRPGAKIQLTPGLAVEPLSVPHRAEFTDTFAYLVTGPSRRLLFLPDIDRWQQLKPPIDQLIERVNIALLDGTFYSSDDLPGRDMSKIPHPPIAETADLLQKIADRGDRKIIFIHLNHSNLLLDEDRRLLSQLRGRGYDIAEEGMQFDL